MLPGFYSSEVREPETKDEGLLEVTGGMRYLESRDGSTHIYGVPIYCSGAGSAAPRSTKFWAVYKHYDVDVCTYPYYSDILAKQSTLPGSSYVV